MLLIDTDNALGSARGDIDDGFALTALLASNLTIAALSGVAGNSSREEALRNTTALARFFKFEGRILATADEVAQFLGLQKTQVTVVALGPLTNIAHAIGNTNRIRELIVVGGHLHSRGRWPPVWPFEFNFTKDRSAAKRVFDSDCPLTIAPLDVCRRLRLDRKRLASLEGPVGTYLKTHCERWLRRSRRRYLRMSVPVWDLVAAIYAVEPSLFQCKEVLCRLHPNGWLEYGCGRNARVIVDYDELSVWACFDKLLTGTELG